MTRTEQAKMRRLELENERLRTQLDKHFQIYRDQLYDSVKLESRLEMIKEAVKE